MPVILLINALVSEQSLFKEFLEFVLIAEEFKKIVWIQPLQLWREVCLRQDKCKTCSIRAITRDELSNKLL